MPPGTISTLSRRTISVMMAPAAAGLSDGFGGRQVHHPVEELREVRSWKRTYNPAESAN
jgi:hypothetical protein